MIQNKKSIEDYEVTLTKGRYQTLSNFYGYDLELTRNGQSFCIYADKKSLSELATFIKKSLEEDDK